MANSDLHSKYDRKKNVQKCLSLLLEYSKNSKQECTHSEGILKEDLKNKTLTCGANLRQDKPCKSFPSVFSNQINEVMHKHVFSHLDNRAANVIMLNGDDFLRLRAGGGNASKSRTENFERNEGSTNILGENGTVEEDIKYRLNNSDSEDTRSQQETANPSSSQIPISRRIDKLKKINFAEKHSSIEASIDQISRDEYLEQRTFKPNLTIMEFDEIITNELKKKRMKNSRATCPQSDSEVDGCLPDFTTVKSALVNSAVSGIPRDSGLTVDFELMEAIDCFLQAERACNFQEALQAAEVAAKLAPRGYEEEAAVQAARNFSQFQLQETLARDALDKKNKEISIVAYVGCTKDDKMQ